MKFPEVVEYLPRESPPITVCFSCSVFLRQPVQAECAVVSWPSYETEQIIPPLPLSVLAVALAFPEGTVGFSPLNKINRINGL